MAGDVMGCVCVRVRPDLVSEKSRQLIAMMVLHASHHHIRGPVTMCTVVAELWLQNCGCRGGGGENDVALRNTPDDVSTTRRGNQKGKEMRV